MLDVFWKFRERNFVELLICDFRSIILIVFPIPAYHLHCTVRGRARSKRTGVSGSQLPVHPAPARLLEEKGPASAVKVLTQRFG